MSRINVKLNARRVYGADGWAVRELLKVATLLHAALAAPPPPAVSAPFSSDVHRQYDLTTKLSEIKQARQLATEITAQGAFLYDLLDKEPNNKMFRERALARPLEMATMEAALRRAAEEVAARAAAQRDALEASASSEAALDAKLERRRAELQRAEMRLHTVHKIKPVYQGELTALETILQELWEQYVLRYRCVEALKHQLSQLETSQAEALEEQRAAILQLIHKYESEDVLGALTDSDELESSDEQRELSQAQTVRPPTRPRTRLRIKTAGEPKGRDRPPVTIRVREVGAISPVRGNSADRIPKPLVYAGRRSPDKSYSVHHQKIRPEAKREEVKKSVVGKLAVIDELAVCLE
ncbi:Clusterin-associated protein 1 [Eumeta japonica]|uniref:Clusterin-associated protein 1 n=1 Tax=Eumeta variegata TaxID=151549 RepID=A0A4C1UWF9_EUMVA|nr:Clusterin-associated protein 1 [Eumeta japonica]